MEKENCIGYVTRELGLTDGGEVMITPTQFNRMFEIAGFEDSEIIVFYHKGDGLPLHMALISKENSDVVYHRKGPGGLIEETTVEELIKKYKNENIVIGRYKVRR